MNTFVIVLLLVSGANTQFSFPALTADQIVGNHLKFRMNLASGGLYVQGVQLPRATNMLKTFWDWTLAANAQTYADSCPTAPSGATGYGENMHYIWTTTPASILDSYAFNAPLKWAEQLSDYGLSSLTMDATILASGVADATQMMWAKTKYVGCGVKNCGPDPTQSNKTRIVAVCHYTPKGNIIGEDIYEQGAIACSNCPAGTVCESYMGMSTSMCV
ncbi:hypothetical protein CAEBREN_15463 [Caenorhabditis brenneri]|uniref:SCP domain-containing protein n=1 Tax=Caenorhabditis brenneri TaxID=135651 RepID=G0PKG4_CAEBE|nr:hypothetical protein CAEBREN_15463 [Caenorhabditis brenneri]